MTARPCTSARTTAASASRPALGSIVPGDREREAAPSANLALHPDPTALGLDDRLGDEQSESRAARREALLLQAAEALEHLSLIAGVDPGPFIVHRDLD